MFFVVILLILPICHKGLNSHKFVNNRICYNICQVFIGANIMSIHILILYYFSNKAIMQTFILYSRKKKDKISYNMQNTLILTLLTTCVEVLLSSPKYSFSCKKKTN